MKAIVIIVALSMVLLSAAVFAGDDANQAARTEVSSIGHVNSSISKGAKSEVPGLMSYQGTLTDGAGVALDTTVSMIFSIYDDSTGGSAKWTETQPSVAVSSGIFNVLLGRVNSIPDTVFTDPERWLGVTVGGDAELAPRQRIAAVGYAFRASEADTADYARASSGVGGWVDDGTVVRLETGTDSVGIGTASPVAKLDVSGDINADSVYMIDEWVILSTKGEYNTMVGANAGLDNTGSSVTFVGRTAGKYNQGNNNTFVGRSTGPNNSIGHGNTFLGSFAGNGNTSGTFNTFVGFEAGLLNTNGIENIFIGREAGRYNESHFNTFIGVRAGYNNTTGTNNTFLGHMAGRGNGTGYGNTFLGVEAGWTNTLGYHNTYVGEDAGRSNPDGDGNVFLGKGAGYSNSSGNGSVFIGHEAGYHETSSNKLYITNSQDSSDVLIYGNFYTGKVGLGTLDPSERLHVAGNAMVDSTVEMAGFKMPTGAVSGYVMISSGSGVGSWQPTGDWTLSEEDMYAAVTGNVGIGTISPTAKLDVSGNLKVGTDGSGYDVNIYGSVPGGKLYWDPDHLALRVGQDSDGTHWVSDSLGVNSFASGYNTVASGSSSVAMGNLTIASGVASIALGSGSEASGDNSCAIGPNSDASGPGSFAVGNSSTASGDNSCAIGPNSDASGPGSFAVGDDATANGHASTAMGIDTEALGPASLATGDSTTASGAASIAMGKQTIASGDFSFAMGELAASSGNSSIAAGKWVTAGPAENTIAIGKGIDSSNPFVNNVPNSFTVGFNTNIPTLFVGGSDDRVGIGTDTPAAELDLRGNLHIGTDSSGHDVNIYGSVPGGRLSWDPDHLAFRVGQDSDGTHWVADSLGDNSFACGFNTVASGSTATAMGTATIASGKNSFAVGSRTIASGDNSFASGNGCTPSADNSFASGCSTTASGLNSNASGDGCQAPGPNSNASGELTNASGGASTSMGTQTTASGTNSVAMGVLTTASGSASIAAGKWVTAGSADNTVTIGKGVDNSNRLVNNISNSLMVGFNITSPTLFVGGADHRVGIGTTSPTRKLWVNGEAGGTTAWYNDSDERLKKNIDSIPEALQKVRQLRGVNFEWKDQEHHEPGQKMGFVAQEAVEIIPEVVSGEDGHYAMQYGPITALLVEAMKEQQEIIDGQQQQIEALTQRLAVLER